MRSNNAAGIGLILGLVLLPGLLVAGEIGAESPAGPPVERIVWRKAPIPVTLTVGRERRIGFPAPVQAGVTDTSRSVLDGMLRIQPVDDTLYLLAYRPFDALRMLVRETGSGAVYLLDLKAVAQDGPDTDVPLQVLALGRDASADDTEDAEAPAPRHGYVALTRFMARQLYAPRRLAAGLPGVARQPLPGDFEVDLVRGGAVAAEPLAAWRSGALHLTTLKLVNRSLKPVVLDPRDLRGEWLAATFQHARLLPAGDPADRTALYLISARPLEEAVPVRRMDLPSEVGPPVEAREFTPLEVH
jgi:integrating conjugative element protein (TIGR03749 family)